MNKTIQTNEKQDVIDKIIKAYHTVLTWEINFIKLSISHLTTPGMLRVEFTVWDIDKKSKYEELIYTYYEGLISSNKDINYTMDELGRLMGDIIRVLHGHKGYQKEIKSIKRLCQQGFSYRKSSMCFVPDKNKLPFYIDETESEYRIYFNKNRKEDGKLFRALYGIQYSVLYENSLYDEFEYIEYPVNLEDEPALRNKLIKYRQARKELNKITETLYDTFEKEMKRSIDRDVSILTKETKELTHSREIQPAQPTDCLTIENTMDVLHEYEKDNQFNRYGNALKELSDMGFKYDRLKQLFTLPDEWMDENSLYRNLFTVEIGGNGQFTVNLTYRYPEYDGTLPETDDHDNFKGIGFSNRNRDEDRVIIKSYPINDVRELTGYYSLYLTYRKQIERFVANVYDSNHSVLAEMYSISKYNE